MNEGFETSSSRSSALRRIAAVDEVIRTDSAEGDASTDLQTRPRANLHRVAPEFFTTIGIPFRRNLAFQNPWLTIVGVVFVGRGRFRNHDGPRARRISSASR